MPYQHARSVSHAVEWLAGYLAQSDALPTTTAINLAAQRVGFSKGTIRTARALVCDYVRVSRDQWVWHLRHTQGA